VPTVFVDADACPVKDEVVRVAERYALDVVLVANAWMRVPPKERVRLEVVPGDFDAADDWIAEHAGEGDVVVTADLPLASRCLAKGARVIGPNGREHTEDNIGDALAGRELMQQLRDMGLAGGGPAPFGKKDRSRFLQSLDRVIQALRRSASS
jgi:uncharacterized protein YaiI (UPF0178 family)